MSENFHETKPRRPLRDVVCDIDKDILRLLLRRHNLLQKMHNARGFLEPSEEKYLRESWENAVARISRDARLSSRFFSLMQEIEFCPRPEEGEERRQAFNLAPPALPVKLTMDGPVSCRTARAWLFLSALSGQAVSLGPCLMNDPLIDCIKLLNQLGASLTREDGNVSAFAGPPLGTPDKVLHVGDSTWNFYLALAHYLGRPSRAKFTGESGLKFVDLSPLRRLLPQLGARLVHVVPKSDGFPVRLESSGVLPSTFILPPDVPLEFAEAMLLAATSYDQAISIDLAQHPQKALISRTCALLQQAGASLNIQGYRITVTPAPLKIPARPAIAMEPELCLYLLALAHGLGGEVVLKGQWADDNVALAGLQLLEITGATIQRTDTEIRCQMDAPLSVFTSEAADSSKALPAELRPLAVALAALAALRNGEATAPELGDDPQVRLDAEGFFSDLGYQILEGRLSAQPHEGEESPARRAEYQAWNAPSHCWAFALALAACAHGQAGFKLGNPGVVTSLYPAFWALYNGLPAPRMQRAVSEAPQTAPKRRRVLTNVTAVLPEPRDEDD